MSDTRNDRAKRRPRGAKAAGETKQAAQTSPGRKESSSSLGLLHEMFPTWELDDLQAALDDAQQDISVAAQNITDGVAQQWGHVKTRKEQRAEKVHHKETQVPAEPTASSGPKPEIKERRRNREVSSQQKPRQQKPKKQPQPQPTKGAAPREPQQKEPAEAPQPAADSDGSKSKVLWSQLLSSAPKPAPTQTEQVQESTTHVPPVQQSQPQQPPKPSAQDKPESQAPSAAPEKLSWAAFLSENTKPRQQPVAKPSAPAKEAPLPAADSTDREAGSRNRRSRRSRKDKKDHQGADLGHQSNDIEVQQTTLQFGSLDIEPSEVPSAHDLGQPGLAQRQPQIPPQIPPQSLPNQKPQQPAAGQAEQYPYDYSQQQQQHFYNNQFPYPQRFGFNDYQGYNEHYPMPNGREDAYEQQQPQTQAPQQPHLHQQQQPQHQQHNMSPAPTGSPAVMGQTPYYPHPAYAYYYQNSFYGQQFGAPMPKNYPLYYNGYRSQQTQQPQNPSAQPSQNSQDYLQDYPNHQGNLYGYGAEHQYQPTHQQSHHQQTWDYHSK